MTNSHQHCNIYTTENLLRHSLAMASQAAYAAEQAIGHQGDAVTAQDVTNYPKGSDSNDTMKALVWQGKNKVEIGQ